MQSNASDLKIQKETSYGLIRAEQAKSAVFTRSQTEEIIRLDMLYNKCIINAIEELKEKLRDTLTMDAIVNIEKEVKRLECMITRIPDLTVEVKKLDSEVEMLIKYDEDMDSNTITIEKFSVIEDEGAIEDEGDFDVIDDEEDFDIIDDEDNIDIVEEEDDEE